MNDIFTVEQIMEWLQTKRATTWGGHGWTTTKEDTCREAAEWFLSQMLEYMDFAHE